MLTLFTGLRIFDIVLRTMPWKEATELYEVLLGLSRTTLLAVLSERG